MKRFDTKSGSLGGVILAGGRGTRLSDKCFKILGNRALVVHVYERIFQVTPEIVIAVKNTQQAYRMRRLVPASQIILDEKEDQSPLVGFLSGLRAIKTHYVFAASCDTPLIETDVIRLLLERAIGNDAAIPVRGDILEPLCAVYRRESALRAAEKSLESRCLSMLEMITQLRKPVQVAERDIRNVDPQLLTLRNINTAEDLAWAEQIIQHMK